MYVVQNCGGYECQGNIVAKGKTIAKAFENFKKKCSYLWDPNHSGSNETPVITHDDDFIYVNGEAEYKFSYLS